MAPRLQLVWKRGPLAPVVVVGEGQVNLGFRPAVVAMAKVSKALWLIDFFDEPNQSPPVAIPVAKRLRNASGTRMGASTEATVCL